MVLADDVGWDFAVKSAQRVSGIYTQLWQSTAEHRGGIREAQM